MDPHSSKSRVPVDYVVKWFGATQFEAVLKLLPEWFPNSNSSMDGEDLWTLILETLVPVTARSLNGVTPVKGRDLSAALKHDADYEAVLEPWSGAVEHLLAVLRYAEILSRSGETYYRGLHWVTMPHMTAEGMALLRRDDDGGWWYERRPRPLGKAPRAATAAGDVPSP